MKELTPSEEAELNSWLQLELAPMCAFPSMRVLACVLASDTDLFTFVVIDFLLIYTPFIFSTQADVEVLSKYILVLVKNKAEGFSEREATSVVTGALTEFLREGASRAILS